MVLSMRACWTCVALTRNSGFASSSNTLYTGAQGSEHSATFQDPGDCATNIAVYPIGTLIYVVVSASSKFIFHFARHNVYDKPSLHGFLQPTPSLLTQQQGLQKYFSVQDSCGACSSQSLPHFDLWMGAPSYNNLTQLTTCADGITVLKPTATVIINPKNGYDVDATALMSSTGRCDTDADYSRTKPVLAGGATTWSDSTGGSTTLSTVVSAAAPGTSPQSDGNDVGSKSCGWDGHCRGAPC